MMTQIEFRNAKRRSLFGKGHPSKNIVVRERKRKNLIIHNLLESTQLTKYDLFLGNQS